MATREEINAIYQKNFGRDADAAGLDYWSQQGGTTASLEASILGGADDNDKEAALNINYNQLFNRDADLEGVNYWMQNDKWAEATSGGAQGFDQTLLTGAKETDLDTYQDNLWSNLFSKQQAWTDKSKEDQEQRLQQMQAAQGNAVSGLASAAQQAGANASSALNYEERNENVIDYVNDYLDEDSALMTKARTSGEQYANSRGLLNSSLAAEASQSAAMDYVVPIASQQANQASQANRSNQNYQQTSALSAQEASQSAQLQAQQNAAAMAIQSAQQSWQATENAASRAATARLAKLDQESSERIAQMQIDQNDRSAVATAMANANQQYNSLMQSIEANTNLDADSRTDRLNSARNWLDTNLTLVEQVYNVDLEW